jgi:hypothetical protein
MPLSFLPAYSRGFLGVFSGILVVGCLGGVYDTIVSRVLLSSSSSSSHVNVLGDRGKTPPHTVVCVLLFAHGFCFRGFLPSILISCSK